MFESKPHDNNDPKNYLSAKNNFINKFISNKDILKIFL